MRRQLSSEARLGRYLVYAIGEIVLVVAGILIALQINNWNEGRKELQTEQRILGILQTEYKYNMHELEKNRQKAIMILNSADSLLLQFKTEERFMTGEEIELHLRRLTAYPTYDPSNGALNDLVNSGKLELIRSDSLRMHLSRWYGVVQDAKEDEARLMDVGDHFLEPYRIKYITYLDDSRFHSDIESALQDRELENIVYLMRGRTNYINRVNLPMLENEINRIMELIEGELNRSSG